MKLLERLFGAKGELPAQRPYEVVIARAREPHWYLDGQVPDTIDGRFDMVAAVLAMLLLRLEEEAGDAAAVLNAQLAERFVQDMDGQLRQIGFGDVVVGKQVGRMMGMLGGRLGAYRDGLAEGDARLGEALVRNLYRGEAPEPAALDHVVAGLSAWRRALSQVPLDAIQRGELP
ncbi:ubiquinol-cytochrome C chaperone family protein [Sphingomonas sp. FW199]|uniref:ubiquinol-cytochrome C chaperone family protein n=1 Tax=Sphingomonas sp. FW199 TaxID=3400217 RepID=UPI003CF5BEF6